VSTGLLAFLCDVDVAAVAYEMKHGEIFVVVSAAAVGFGFVQHVDYFLESSEEVATMIGLNAAAAAAAEAWAVETLNLVDVAAVDLFESVAVDIVVVPDAEVVGAVEVAVAVVVTDHVALVTIGATEASVVVADVVVVAAACIASLFASRLLFLLQLALHSK